MILRYKRPHVSVHPALCSLFAWLHALHVWNSLQPAHFICVYVPQGCAVCVHHTGFKYVTACEHERVRMFLCVQAHGPACNAFKSRKCEWPQYDELASWFQLGWVVIKSSLLLLVSPALHRLPRSSIPLHSVRSLWLNQDKPQTNYNKAKKAQILLSVSHLSPVALKHQGNDLVMKASLKYLEFRMSFLYIINRSWQKNLVLIFCRNIPTFSHVNTANTEHTTCVRTPSWWQYQSQGGLCWKEKVHLNDLVLLWAPVEGTLIPDTSQSKVKPQISE